MQTSSPAIAPVCPAALGVEIVFRVINANVRTMDELGLPEHLKLLTRYQNGLILATGSGRAPVSRRRSRR